MFRGLGALAAAAAAVALAGCAGVAPDGATPHDTAVPRYAHVFVIVEENKDYAQIVSGPDAPNISRLAAQYGNATQFFSEVHPSEANYVALLGGDTFGIHDDDAYYCVPGQVDVRCTFARFDGYPSHTVTAPQIGDQLLARRLTWKGYYESLPEPGSLAVVASDPKIEAGTGAAQIYAAKHSGFLNFASVQKDPARARRIVGFDQLDADLASGALPSFALIVPNQCNEMHGQGGPNLPADCASGNVSGLIRRGDAFAGALVARLQATAAWKTRQNMAIVITFDEGSGGTRGGCCGVTPDAPSNYGGGHIPTIVITNHGPRGVADDTPYNHYSLLRTLQDAFGLRPYLAHAAETDKGVVAMDKLFGVKR